MQYFSHKYESEDVRVAARAGSIAEGSEEDQAHKIITWGSAESMHWCQLTERVCEVPKCYGSLSQALARYRTSKKVLSADLSGPHLDAMCQKFAHGREKTHTCKTNMWGFSVSPLTAWWKQLCVRLHTDAGTGILDKTKLWECKSFIELAPGPQSFPSPAQPTLHLQM